MPSLETSNLWASGEIMKLKIFLWVLIIEGIQNIPAMAGMVFALGTDGLLPYALSFLGMMTTAIVISLTENIKLRFTNLDQEESTFLGTLGYGAGLSVFSWVYIYVSQWGDWQRDLLVGAIMGALLSVASFKRESWFTPRFFSHTISFAVAAAGILYLLRLAKTAEMLGEKVAFVILTTIIMTVIIAVIDYGPFLQKNAP